MQSYSLKQLIADEYNLSHSLEFYFKKEADIELQVANDERRDVIRAAARLANALVDINNDIGEVSEIKKVIETIHFDITHYAGLEDIKDE